MKKTEYYSLKESKRTIDQADLILDETYLVSTESRGYIQVRNIIFHSASQKFGMCDLLQR